MSERMRPKVIIAGKCICEWEKNLVIDTELSVRATCPAKTPDACIKKGICDKFHLLCDQYKPPIVVKGHTVLLTAVYLGEPIPPCDYVLFDYPRPRSRMESHQSSGEGRGLVVPYTPPTAEELRNQPQLGSSASSASNQARGWGQVSSVVVLKEPTLEEKRKSFEKNKDRLALDEKILAVEEQIEKLMAEKVALEVLRKQLE